MTNDNEIAGLMTQLAEAEHRAYKWDTEAQAAAKDCQYLATKVRTLEAERDQLQRFINGPHAELKREVLAAREIEEIVSLFSEPGESLLDTVKRVLVPCGYPKSEF